MNRPAGHWWEAAELDGALWRDGARGGRLPAEEVGGAALFEEYPEPPGGVEAAFRKYYPFMSGAYDKKVMEAAVCRAMMREAKCRSRKNRARV